MGSRHACAVVRIFFVTVVVALAACTLSVGGALVGSALGRLEVLLPPDPEGDPQWADLISPAGFAIKKDSCFELWVDFDCLKWPEYGNDVRVSLFAHVLDQKGRDLLTFQAARWGGRVSERYEIHMYDHVEKQGYTYEYDADDESGRLSIHRDAHGFWVVCKAEGDAHARVLQELQPSVREPRRPGQLGFEGLRVGFGAASEAGARRVRQLPRLVREGVRRHEEVVKGSRRSGG